MAGEAAGKAEGVLPAELGETVVGAGAVGTAGAGCTVSLDVFSGAFFEHAAMLEKQITAAKSMAKRVFTFNLKTFGEMFREK